MLISESCEGQIRLCARRLGIGHDPDGKVRRERHKPVEDGVWPYLDSHGKVAGEELRIWLIVVQDFPVRVSPRET